MNSTQAVTQTISERLAERIGNHSYHMWFGNTTRLQVEGSCVRVATDNRFVADWIDRHFRADLTGAARETLGDRAQIDLQVAPDLSGSEDRPTPPTAPARRNTGTAPRTALRRLDDFIVGTSNRLAYTAAIRIAEGTAGSTSPLYLHGECGVGKTHLLQGIAHAVRHRARYVTAEQFTNEYINAIRTNAIDRFRRQTRKLRLLAIDDVHFLSNKTATQREFLHTIDAIDLSGSRLVLASDDHPLRLGFAEALSSRFVAGMVAGIDRPDRETRIALIHKLAAARGLRISDIGTERIAGHCVGSVREIEGAVNKLAALQAVTGGNGAEVGIVAVEQVFNDGSWRPKTRLHVNTVIDTVCARMVVNRAELMSSGRHRRVVAARGLVAYLARTLTTLSYPEIAHALGRKHHSTVHTAVGRITRQLGNHTRIEVSEHGDSVCLRELLDQLRHEILSAR